MSIKKLSTVVVVGALSVTAGAALAEDLTIKLGFAAPLIAEEGYDLAICISRTGSSSYAARKLATSHNIVCASPAYLRKNGSPTMPSELIKFNTRMQGQISPLSPQQRPSPS